MVGLGVGTEQSQCGEEPDFHSACSLGHLQPGALPSGARASCPPHLPPGPGTHSLKAGVTHFQAHVKKREVMKGVSPNGSTRSMNTNWRFKSHLGAGHTR